MPHANNKGTDQHAHPHNLIRNNVNSIQSLHSNFIRINLVPSVNTPIVKFRKLKVQEANCWTSVYPAFQSWFAVEYLSCFNSLMNLDLYVHCFDSLMTRGPSCGPNFYVYMNHSRT